MNEGRTSPVFSEGRRADGRFGKGNPGRPKGARGKATMAMLQLMEKDAKAIAAKAVELAKEGDSTALRLCLDRLLAPVRDRPLTVALPMPETAAQIPQTLAAVLQAAAVGQITAAEAERLARAVESFGRAHTLADFDERLRKLEAGEHAS